MNCEACLTREGLVFRDKDTFTTVRLNHEETTNFLGKNVDFDKLDHYCEIVHIEISNRCDLNCSYCYAGQMTGDELTTEQWFKVFDTILAYKPFQLTFGGGEPTMREDLNELAGYVKSKKVPICMTTNGVRIAEGLVGKDMLALFDMINVSVHYDNWIEPRVSGGTLLDVAEALNKLRDAGVKIGISVVCMLPYVPFINREIARLCKEFDAELLLLSAKVGPEYRALKPAAVIELGKKVNADHGIPVAVDGLACSAISEEFCKQRERFCDISSQGDMFPCSFIREPVGNLLDHSFKELWKQRGSKVPCPYLEVPCGKKI